MKKRGLSLLLCLVMLLGVLSTGASAATSGYTTNNKGKVDFKDGKYTATYESATDGNQYLLLVLKSTVAINSWTSNTDSVMYIDQKQANGTTVSFEFVPKTNAASNVYLCGTTAAGSEPILLGTILEQSGLATPTLSSVVASSAGITLKWTDVDANATSIEIDRYDSVSKAWTKGFKTVAATKTGYVDADVTEGVTYTYRIRAVGASGTSAYSTRLQATAVAMAAAPLAPATFTATPQSNGIKLAWAASEGAVTYVIERYSKTEKVWDEIGTLKASNVSCTDKKATAGVQYLYRIKAVNEAGASAWKKTTEYVSWTSAAVAPATPTLKTVTAAAEGITLTWTADANTTSIEIDRYDNASKAWTVKYKTVAVSPASYLDAAVTEGVTYTYRIRAVGAGGTSANSARLAATAVAMLAKPEAPATLTTTVTETGIRLEWAKSEGAETYEIERYSKTAKVWVEIGTINAKNHACTDKASITGLEAGVLYVYRVRAVNDAGSSAWTKTTEYVSWAGAAVAPATPTLQSVTAAAAGITLTWTADANTTSIEIDRYDNASKAWTVKYKTVAVSPASYLDANVTAGVTYTYRIRAVGAGGTSANSARLAETAVAMLAKPEAPATLTTTATATGVRLEWARSEGATSYVIERYSKTAKVWVEIGTINAKNLACTDKASITGLEAGVLYVYRVKAVNDAGSSAWTKTTEYVTWSPAA